MRDLVWATESTPFRFSVQVPQFGIENLHISKTKVELTHENFSRFSIRDNSKYKLQSNNSEHLSTHVINVLRILQTIFYKSYLLSSSMILLSFPSTFLFISVSRSSFRTLLVFSTSARLRTRREELSLFLRRHSGKKIKTLQPATPPSPPHPSIPSLPPPPRLHNSEQSTYTCFQEPRSFYSLVSPCAQVSSFHRLTPPTCAVREKHWWKTQYFT